VPNTLLNIREVAKHLRVPVSFLYARTCRNSRETIPHFKLGKHLRFDPTQLRKWLSAHARGRTRGERAISTRKVQRHE
jgi:excisionase family DNA binding protein